MSDSLWPHGFQHARPPWPCWSLPKFMSIELVTIKPSHPLSPPSPPTLNLSQHQSLFQWISSSHHMAQVSGFSSGHLATEFLSLGFSRAQTLLAVQSASSFWWPGAMFAPGKLWSHWNEVHSILFFWAWDSHLKMMEEMGPICFLHRQSSMTLSSDKKEKGKLPKQFSQSWFSWEQHSLNYKKKNPGLWHNCIIILWHHQLNGHKFEQTPGNSEGQGSLACCRPWGHRVGHNWATEQQQWHNCNIVNVSFIQAYGKWWINC